MASLPTNIAQITALELAAQLLSDNPPCVLDVREPMELKLARLDNTLDVPMNQVPKRLEWLQAQQNTRALVVLCHSGVRSAAIAGFLQQNGFDRVFNLQGGIHAWSEQVDRDVPTY